MGPYVLDASVAVSWALQDEAASKVVATAAAWAEEERIHAPELLWYEVRNALIVSLRCGRIDRGGVRAYLKGFAGLRLHLHGAGDEDATMDLAEHRRLSVYDAAYLELAKRMGLPLATLDRALTEAAKAEGVELVG